VAIWLIVHAIREDAARRVNPLNGTMTYTFENVPVLVVSSAADVREFKVKPDTVKVMVNGKPEIIKALEAKQLHVMVDLTGIEAAQGLKKRVEVSAPPGVTLISIVPAEVDVAVPPKMNP
jgi:hypothetical protein